MHNCEHSETREREMEHGFGRSNEATPPHSLTDQSLPSCSVCVAVPVGLFTEFLSLSLFLFCIIFEEGLYVRYLRYIHMKQVTKRNEKRKEKNISK